jgi:hypothetical protein
MGIKEELTKERGKSDTMLAAPWIIWIGFITGLLFTLTAFSIDFKGDDPTVVRLIALGMTVIFVPYPPYQKWLKETYEKITEFLGKLFVFGVFLIIGAFILWGGWKILGKGIEFITPDTWDLMICKELHSDGMQCQSNEYVLKDYRDQKSCMEKGIELASNKGFECGKNCRNDSSWGTVCETICNRGGCN